MTMDRRLLLAALCLTPGASVMASELPAGLVAEFAPAGRLRAAINYGNPVLAKRDAAGNPGGVSVALARTLAARLRVPLDIVPYEGAGLVTDAAKAGVWDIAFLAVDPRRAAEVDFTAPYVVIEGTYLVRENSPIRTIDDADKPGQRILVRQGSAYDLFLTRSLKQAELVRMGSSAPYLDDFLAGSYAAAGGVREALAAFARAHAGLRVIEGRFVTIEQAMVLQKGRPAALRFLRAFLEEMKASGFVERALRDSGEADAAVAPAARVD